MIDILIPDMPTADDLLPYLRRIDTARYYTNRGQLVLELEQSLSDLVDAPVVTVGNGTAAIELALHALGLPRGAAVAVPAMTFVASGQAIHNAQLRPSLVDADPFAWQVDPDAVRDAIRIGLPIRAVVVVAAYGAPVPIEPWEEFVHETGRPVVIDAAGALGEQKVSTSRGIVTAFSLHATKFIGAGEGGAVASHDEFISRRVREMSMFGRGGGNSKMSEYHAAVGLASLDTARMERRLARGAEIAQAYATALAKIPEIVLQRKPSPQATILPLLLPEGCRASGVIEGLTKRGIGARQWYRPFLDELPQFKSCPRPEYLPVTEMLRTRLIAVPFHTSMTTTDVRTVCSTLASLL